MPLTWSAPNLRQHPEAEIEVQRGSLICPVGKKVVVYYLFTCFFILCHVMKNVCLNICTHIPTHKIKNVCYMCIRTEENQGIGKIKVGRQGKVRDKVILKIYTMAEWPKSGKERKCDL